MTAGTKIIISVAGALATGLAINYLLHTEKGSELGQQLRKAVGDLLEKGKEVLNKTQDEAVTNLQDATI